MASQEVYLAPCSHERPKSHFQATVLNGVHSDVYRDHTNLDFGEIVGIWGLTPGLEPTWEGIEAGDYFLFYFGNEKYRYAARVLTTERNRDLALDLWPDYSSKAAGGGDTTDPWEFIIYLDDPIEIAHDSSGIHSWAGHAINYPQGFMRLNDDGQAAIRRKFGSIEDFVDSEAIAGETTPTADDVESNEANAGSSRRIDPEEWVPDIRPPKRVETQISRIIRNTSIVRDLKEKYDYQCQVCGEVRMRGIDEPYAEGHHLHPLGDSPPGPDDQSNLLILCPNHHADFDYGMIRIDPESLEIEHAYESLEQDSLAVLPGHDLNSEYIEYNNRETNF